MHTQRRYATCFGMSKKEKIKDAYPKKVCHMLRHVKKKDSPLSKKKEKERWCIQRSSYTIHQKISTLFAHLDQGLWLVSSLNPVFDLGKYEKQVCLQILHTYSSTKIAIRDRLRKKGRIKSIGEELYTLSDPRDHPRNFINFFWKTLQNLQIDGWAKEKEIWALYNTVLTLNRQRWGEAISSTRVR